MPVTPGPIALPCVSARSQCCASHENKQGTRVLRSHPPVEASVGRNDGGGVLAFKREASWMRREPGSRLHQRQRTNDVALSVSP